MPNSPGRLLFSKPRLPAIARAVQMKAAGGARVGRLVTGFAGHDQ